VQPSIGAHGMVPAATLQAVILALLAGMKGFRPDAIIMDAPRIYHLSKFLMFLCVEGLLIATGVLAYSKLLCSTAHAAHNSHACMA
jgi:hypothetical protein